MILDRKTQKAIVVGDKRITLGDKNGDIEIPFGSMVSINYSNDGESVTFTTQGDESNTYTIHLTDPFGNAIETDASARDLSIRIINLLEI